MYFVCILKFVKHLEKHTKLAVQWQNQKYYYYTLSDYILEPFVTEDL